MSQAIAFLSGKGGSGKTTLSLSMADLLSQCNASTLLIDCDLSTNGATYFYESLLSTQNHIDSFAQYLNNQDNDLQVSDYEVLPKSRTILSQRNHSHYDNTNNTLPISPIFIKQNYYFIPSISMISDQQAGEGILPIKHILEEKLYTFISQAKKTYDVILFDCQAGYTELLPVLLPLMDIVLFVLEADSISASSMRNLHLKIGNSIGQAKQYQVFNKASQEEYDIYSKVTGTFFTNIGTLQFDWKIRQAFSRSQTPDLNNISSKYGSALCEVCKILFPYPPIKRNLIVFSDNMLIQQEKEECNQLELELARMAKNPHHIQNKYLALLLLFIGILVILPFTYISIKLSDIISQSLELQIVFIIAGSALFSALTIFYITIVSSSREERKLRNSYEQKLLEKKGYIKKLVQELNQAKKYVYEGNEKQKGRYEAKEGASSIE